jgi:hypothetical protein
MAEIQKGNRADVEQFLCDCFVKEIAENVERTLPIDNDKPRESKSGWNGKRIHRAYASDYAEIAEFLSTQERWEPAVKKVSDLLREHYIASLLMGRTNAFTSAISMIAPPLGFSKHQRFLSLAGFTDRNAFRGFVQQEDFWKDAVSSNHGEHSHSIQWLTLAKARIDKELTTQADIATLYRQSVDYACTRELYHADSRTYRVLLLWDWLVDCFDHGDKDADFKTNITSRTARSPTHLNKYLFEQGSSVDDALWIGQYLADRHKKRGWELPAVGRTNLRDHAIASAGAKGHSQIEANNGGNFVYKVNNMRNGANRLSKVHGLGVSEQIARMVIAWGQNPVPSFSFFTSLNVPVTLTTKVCVPEQFSKKGTYNVRIQIEDKVGGCEATVVEVVK